MTTSDSTPSTDPNVRVLVVDDEVDLRDLAVRRLRRAGYGVAEAGDGEQAWQHVLTTPTDLLVLDIRMPILGGLELARRMRDDERTKDVGIIFLTASVHEDEEAAGAAAGADAYLRKPCTTADLLAAVEQVASRGGTA